MRPTEDEIIARYLAPMAGDGAFGLRDDAALLDIPAAKQLVVTTDMLVAGVHFLPLDPPGTIAAKALRVNLSDLAAKAAEPAGILLGLGLPDDWAEPWLAAFVAGLREDLARFACPLLGGDTTATPGPLTISVTAFGLVDRDRFVRRTGTRPGDILFVTGTIGDGALGLKACQRADADRAWLERLDASSVTALVDRYRRPEPRLGLRAALSAHARAAMDVSDGLVGDLDKMLRLEGLTTRIRSRIVPFSRAARAAIAQAPDLLATALTGGDDYELLCAVAPAEAAAFQTAAEAAGIQVSPIAVATEGDARISVLDVAGVPLDLPRSGFQHFINPTPPSA